MHDNVRKIYDNRIADFLKSEMRHIYPESALLDAVYAKSAEPVKYADRLNLEYKPIQEGDVWGKAWDSAWFHITGQVPESFAGKEICLRIGLGGESLVFDESGCPIFGLTHASIFNRYYYKDRFPLPKSVKAGDKIDYWVEAAANALFGVTQPAPDDPVPAPENICGTYTPTILQLKVCVFDREVWELLYDIRELYEIMTWTPKENYHSKQLLHILNKALDIYNYQPANAAKTRKYLAETAYSQHAADSALTACTVGHAHIDVGWLWPVRESIRKAARTFSSQLALMEQDPDYIFGASQAVLYKMIKDNYPALFEKIKQRVKEGRWEIQGGMWVEADANLISGESMVRQFLHAKNFFMDEFGFNVRNLWLPDVFGYSASMPQIIKRAGCDYFLTQKISWSKINTFPHNTFLWQGVDGTQVLTHFPPENNYNASCTADQRIVASQRFAEAGYLDRFMSLIGIGDGGGGPSEEYLAGAKRMRDLEGVPKSVFSRADTFFEYLNQHKDELPVWVGELYLEMHRGTLTTQSRTKRNNRKCEQALSALEFLASHLPEDKYPAKELDTAWKTVLINQFHDIIPGSSIKLVYDTTEKQHAEILKCAADQMDRAAALLFPAKEDSAILVNSLSTDWEGTIQLPDSWKDATAEYEDGEAIPTQLENGQPVAFVRVPASSFLTIVRAPGKPAKTAATRKFVLENELISYEFDQEGHLVSALDKESGRQFLTAPGNVLSLYVDRPHEYDAWDVDLYYPRDFLKDMPCTEITKAVTGPVRSFLTITFSDGSSTITQKVCLEAGTRRLDFVTHADWHESRLMLRTAFPVAVQAPEATFDIQYAFLTRPTHDNTSWDLAKFETCGQRYADLSCADYGVAILNDCKYGYRIKGSTLDLNLLRSPKHPHFEADQGAHDFTYSFFPHQQGHVEGGVIQAAACLNRAPYLADGRETGKADVMIHQVSGNGVSLEILKKAEKDASHIVRLVETNGHESTAVFSTSAKKISETSLMEWEHGEEVPVQKGFFCVTLKPFEIRTLRLE